MEVFERRLDGFLKLQGAVPVVEMEHRSAKSNLHHFIPHPSLFQVKDRA